MENIQAIADKSAIHLPYALHCLLLPAAIVLYPSSLGFLPGDESVHFALLFLVIPVSAYALIKGGKVHKSRKVFIVGISGLLVLWQCCFRTYVGKLEKKYLPFWVPLL